MTLTKRRQDFEEAMQALDLPEHYKLALRAAASAWAKASAINATASYIDTHRVLADGQQAS